MKRAEAVIVGCGPAGLAAAVQLKRLGLTPVVFEKGRIGGLLVNAHLVENYPGFPEGIRGIELVGLMKEHLRRLGIEVMFEEVTLLEPDGCGFVVRTPLRYLRAASVMVASGTRPRDIDVQPVPDRIQDRILHEVYPILEVRDKCILVVGSGDAAFDYALSLTARNDVTIVNRGGKLKCLPSLWECAAASPRIKYLDKTEPVSLAPTDNGGVEVVCSTLEGQTKLTADYVIFATGREPELSFASDSVVDNLTLLLEEGGLHLIGDVRTGDTRQTAIAVGDGVMAAMRVFKKVEDLRRCG